MICRARCTNCGNQKEIKGAFSLGKCDKCGKGPWDAEIGNGSTYPDGWVHGKSIQQRISAIFCAIFGHKSYRAHVSHRGVRFDVDCSRCGELHRLCEVRGNRIVNKESDASKPARAAMRR